MLKDFRIGYPAVIAALEAMNPQPTPAQPVVPQRVPLDRSAEQDDEATQQWERDNPPAIPVLQYREPAYVPEWARPPEVTFELRLSGGEWRPEGGIRPLVYGTPSAELMREAAAAYAPVESIAASGVPEGATHRHPGSTLYFRRGPNGIREAFVGGRWKENDNGFSNDTLDDTKRGFIRLAQLQPAAPTEWQSGLPPSIGWREVDFCYALTGPSYFARWDGASWCNARAGLRLRGAREIDMHTTNCDQALRWRGPRVTGKDWPEPSEPAVAGLPDGVPCDATHQGTTDTSVFYRLSGGALFSLEAGYPSKQWRNEGPCTLEKFEREWTVRRLREL